MAHIPLQDTDAEIRVNISCEVSDSEAVHAQASLAEHHSNICPNCGERLTGHRCKLLCVSCGYYMSCADYY